MNFFCIFLPGQVQLDSNLEIFSKITLIVVIIEANSAVQVLLNLNFLSNFWTAHSMCIVQCNVSKEKCFDEVVKLSLHPPPSRLSFQGEFEKCFLCSSSHIPISVDKNYKSKNNMYLMPFLCQTAFSPDKFQYFQKIPW